MKKLSYINSICLLMILSSSLFSNKVIPLADKTYTSNASGNWTTGANWSGSGTPASPNSANNSTINIAAATSITLTADYNLKSGTVLNIACGSTLTIIGSVQFDNGSTLIVSGCPGNNGILIINGNLTNSNNSNKITINGEIILNGNYSGGTGSTLDGTGSAKVSGAVTTSGTGSVFGSEIDCTVGCSSSAVSPLPIELISFNGNIENNNKVHLTWQTATEKNNSHFEIERSIDGFVFETIEKIKSKSNDGNSFQTLNYETYDNNPLNGISYYRLKQFDYSSKNSNSEIISVTRTTGTTISFVIFPNPNNGDFFVNVNGIENNHDVEILIYDDKQSIIFNSKTDINSMNDKSFNFQLQNNIKPGLYQVLFVMEGIKYSSNLIIQ